jgi:hypothetical protein
LRKNIQIFIKNCEIKTLNKRAMEDSEQAKDLEKEEFDDDEELEDDE